MSQPAPSDTRLRLRAVLNAQFALLLAACLLVAAAGGVLIYTVQVDPGTETQTETVSSLTVETEYVHSAEVTEPNPVFDTGTVLNGRNTYFTRAAPVLDVAVETSYAADAASDVAVSSESVLVVRNVGSDGETVYWQEREPLATETVSGVAPGETATASFSLNSSEVNARADRIESDLGASPGEREAFVTTTVTVDGAINGEQTSYTRTVDMTLTHSGETYSVSEPGVQSETVERTEPVTVERRYGPLRSVGGPLLLVAGIAGAGGLLYARREVGFALTPAETAYLDYRDDRSEFAEWVTEIRLPESAHDRPEAEAATLRDLVDFAIDNDAGVVEDPRTGAYHAVTDEFVYTYAPPTLATAGDPAERAGGDGSVNAVGTGPDGVESLDGPTQINDDVSLDEAWRRAGFDPGVVPADRLPNGPAAAPVAAADRDPDDETREDGD